MDENAADNNQEVNPFAKKASQDVFDKQEQRLRRIIIGFCFQWLTIAILVSIFNASESLSDWITSDIWISVISGILSVALVFIFTCLPIGRYTIIFVIWSLLLTTTLGTFLSAAITVVPTEVPLYSIIFIAAIFVTQAAFVSQTTIRYTAKRGLVLTLALYVLSNLLVDLVLDWLTTSLSTLIAVIVYYLIYVYALRMVEADILATYGTTG
ncbi:hypothetical protein HDE_14329 [Halotydeus destructor]|nr:hypothetical protein HDE_14329 [Halotydeus destructor]